MKEYSVPHASALKAKLAPVSETPFVTSKPLPKYWGSAFLAAFKVAANPKIADIPDTPAKNVAATKPTF